MIVYIGTYCIPGGFWFWVALLPCLLLALEGAIICEDGKEPFALPLAAEVDMPGPVPMTAFGFRLHGRNQQISYLWDLNISAAFSIML